MIEHDRFNTSLKTLLKTLTERGVRLTLEGEQLKIQAPKGSLTPELQAELKQSKADLIAFLQSKSHLESPDKAALKSRRYPLSPVQQRLWFLQQLEPQSARYHEAAAFELPGKLNPEQLHAALQALMQRHEILYTGFGFEQGQSFQYLQPDITVPLSHQLYSEAALQAFVLRPFVLEQAPLWRVAVFDNEAHTILVLVFHHLITDFWSAGLALQEIIALWHHQALPPVPLHYGELAQALNQTPSSEALNTFWQQCLQDTCLQLELEHSAAAFQASSDTLEKATSLVEIKLSADELALWEQQARQQQVTRFSYLLSAWQVFLTYWFDLETQTRPVIGFPIAGRHQREHENILGCFVNTLLCPFGQPKDQRFSDYLQAQQQQVIDILQHAQLGFESLVEQLNPPRGMPYFPQLGIVMQDQWDQIPWQIDGQALKWRELDFLPPKFELLLSYLGFRQSLRLQFDPQMHDATVMQSLLHCFKDFFISVLQAPEQSLSAFQFLTQVPEVSFKPSVSELANPDWQCLHQGVEFQARTCPDQIALRWGEQSMSYAQLNQRANQLAHELIQQGVQTGDRIAIQARVSFELIIALLAILKTGCCYVPLDQDIPPVRRQALLADMQARLMIYDTEAPVDLGLPCQSLSSLLEASQNQSSESLDLTFSPDHLAYMIYTSGSTGQPNGVCISHRQVCRLFDAMQAVFAHDASDTGILFHSIAFDYSIWEIWGALVSGMKLVLLDRSDARDPEKTWQIIQAHEVTILNQTPSAFRYLSRVAIRNPVAPALRALILSGEKLELIWLQDFFKHFERVQIFNSYGITETTVFVSWRQILSADLQQGHSLIGPALPDLAMHILDADLNPVPAGKVGEICVSGAGLSIGYWQRPELTAQRFVQRSQGRLYRSGDLARILPNGELVYLGRRDLQVKIRGYRIETGEIQAALEALPQVQSAYVAVNKSSSEARLIAWVIPNPDFDTFTNMQSQPTQALRESLHQSLPTAMIPAEILWVSHFPLNQNGKIDLATLWAQHQAQHQAQDQAQRQIAQAALPAGSLEQQILAVLSELLPGPVIGLDDSFFDLGAHSLMMVDARERLKTHLQIEVELLDLFHFPTVRQLAQHLRQQNRPSNPVAVKALNPQAAHRPSQDIAIIGIALRFPGADSPDLFWEHLKNGTELIQRLNPQQLEPAGISPLEYQADDYVPALGWCSGIEYFDAPFFGLSTREAEILDPQQRLMLQLAWQATEQAGYGNHQQAQSIGVFASAGLSRYLMFHLAPQALPADLQPMQILIANDKDFLATRIAHKLNLTGPALTVQSACSSSLAAVHLACESLRRGECQMALAGGVTLETRQQGYTWLEGGIYSRDGHCRPFDADATGIVGGSGGGWVLLKPLEQAQADQDLIYAVIKGSAMNNDGANKAGYLAPSVTGQIDVIQQALQNAGVSPRQIGVVEAHGTGTPLGDPIEVKALHSAWLNLASPLPQRSCALGSLKGNIGHLDAAAGIAGLIKAALMLHHQMIAPSINLRQVNPALNLEKSPFYIPQQSQKWQGPERFAAVSSLGMGGTNVHVILASHDVLNEPVSETPHSSEPVLLAFSAPDRERFEAFQQDLLTQVQAQNSLDLAAISRELLLARQGFDWRASIVVQDQQQALDALATLRSHKVQASPTLWLWLCPGLGSQSPAMGQHFWHLMPAYRQAIEACQQMLQSCPEPGFAADLQSLLCDPQIPSETLARPEIMQVLIYCHSYALGQAYLALGLQPDVLIGHSFGEYAAVTLAGMVTLEQMLPLVVLRGQLFAQLAKQATGGVLSVMASAATCQGLLTPELEIASINHPERLTLSGPREALTEFIARSGLHCRWLDIPHVVHHRQLEGLLASLDHQAASIQWLSPVIPVWSGLHHDWHQGPLENAYWSQQARQLLRFDRALEQVQQTGHYQALELGSGRHLSSLCQLWQIPAVGGLKNPERLWQALGQIWQSGQSLQWQSLNLSTKRQAVPLTRFAQHRYWIEPALDSERSSSQALRPLPFENWFQLPGWKQSHIALTSSETPWQKMDWDSEAVASKPAVNQMVLEVPLANNLDMALKHWQQLQQKLIDLAQLSWQGCVHLLCAPFSSLSGSASEIPWHALYLGLVRTVALEFPGLALRLIEATDSAQVSPVEWQHSEPHVLWQQGRRWIPDWQTQSPTQHVSEPVLKVGGVYLITGISGGLGRIFSDYLHQTYQAQVIGISRQPVALESCRSYVADVTDFDALKEVLTEILARYGRLDGIIHTAGIAGHHLLAQLQPEDLSATLAAKVQGTLNLQQLLQTVSIQPDFVLLCSALASQLGSPGQSAYAAANAWLDVFAQQQGLPWLSINWGAWQGQGMAAQALQQLPALFRPLYAQLLKWGIQAELGTQALEQSLRLSRDYRQSQILVSPLSLAALDAFQSQSWQKILAASRQVNTLALDSETIDFEHLSNPPQGELESQIARVWQQCLGQAPERDQRFSELGGDSLMILQMKSLLEHVLSTSQMPELPMAPFLQDLPLHDLALLLEQALQTPQQTQFEVPSSVAVANADLLVKLNRVQQQSPLYFVHAVSGTVFPFRHLADVLPYPLYGLQSHGLIAQLQPDSIPEMARAYLNTIVQHELLTDQGYWLGGWSFGALVAYEMACQALEQGLPVKQLVLLDMQAPTPGQLMDLKEQDVRARFEADLAALGQVPGIEKMKQNLWLVFEANVQATQSFEPRPCKVPALLLVAEDGFGRSHFEPDLGWSHYLPDLQVVRIPGDHYSCLEPEQIRQWVHYLTL